MKKFMKKIKRKFLKRLLSACTVFGLTLFLSGIPSFAAEKVYFYHTDAAGTPMAMTDSSGNVVWEADYKPFGEEQEVTAFPENNKRFIGKEKDEETGLYYFGARYLDAGIGRFTKPDPVGISEGDLMNPQRFNRYAYSLNNPYRYVDPDGELPILLVPIIYAAFEVGLSAYDAYDTAITVFSSETSMGEKGIAVGLFAAGIVAPGGGYSKLDDIAEAGVKATKKAIGRTGKQARLKGLAKDPKVSSKDRGLIKQDMNQIKRGKRTTIRVPNDKNLAHRRGYEAKKGHSYEHSDLQGIDLHRLQHKYEGY